MNKNRKVFIKYDIKDFYLSITENILLDALMFAKSFVCLNPDHIALILHCRKSVLFHGGEAWINKSDTGNFDVLEGSFDRTEVAELIGIFILNKINKIVHIDDHGLYRDNGLIVAPENKRSSDPPPKKKLHRIFKDLKFNITVEINKKVVQFLDTVKPVEWNHLTFYENKCSCKILNTASNHPSNIIKQITLEVQHRLSQNSSTEDICNEKKKSYVSALKKRMT